jgi:hypothetical protein
MKSRVLILTCVFRIAFWSEPLFAHHNVEETYDTSKEFTVTGKVSEIRWENPHVSLAIDVKGPDGRVVTWQVSIAPPNSLSKINFRRDTVALSSSITMKMWPARDGSHSATGLMLTLADGKQFDVHDALGWRRVL